MKKSTLLYSCLCLGLLINSPSHAQSEAPSVLENTSWQLVEIRSSAGFNQVPENREDYLLRFRLNKRAEITADCNSAGATWNHDGESMRLTELVTTRKLCIAPTLFNFYIMYLQTIGSVRHSEEQLILVTDSGGVELEFEPYIFRPQF